LQAGEKFEYINPLQGFNIRGPTFPKGKVQLLPFLSVFPKLLPDGFVLRLFLLFLLLLVRFF
jgi:hypothetical protein